VEVPGLRRYLASRKVALLVGCLVIACADEDLWDYEGVCQVWVETMEAPDTLRAADTLAVILEGEGWCDQPIFSHVDTARDSFQVDFAVWADCYTWSGSGMMPPTDYWVRCELEVPPPFYSGRLLLLAYRPDSTTVSDTVLVVP
jgi:hypothetical protein